MIEKGKIFILLIILFLAFSSFSIGTKAKKPTVLLLEIDDEIDHSTVEILKEAISQAKYENFSSILILMDTPGGGLSETQEIAEIIEQSTIPIISFVFPSGAAAWSAGTFILLSSHVAAMTNHTTIGSCQPVKIGPWGTEPVENNKTINALTEWIANRAKMYDRNQSMAKKFITNNKNLNASEAKKNNIIEFVAESPNSLMKKINGKNITISNETLTLHTKNAVKKHYHPSPGILVMEFLSKPVLTSLLLILGIYALILGITTPGYGAEVFGVISILLSLIGSGFAVSELSIIFLIIGALLLLIEVFVIPGFGVVGIGGIISLTIGAIFLVPSYGTTEWMINMEWINQLIYVVLFAVALIAVFFVFLLYKVLRVRFKKEAIGVFKGESAKAVDKIAPENPGYVLFKGEYWRAKSEKPIDKDEKVLIIKKENSVLLVKPQEEDTKH